MTEKNKAEWSYFMCEEEYKHLCKKAGKRFVDSLLVFCNDILDNKTDLEITGITALLLRLIEGIYKISMEENTGEEINAEDNEILKSLDLAAENLFLSFCYGSELIRTSTKKNKKQWEEDTKNISWN